MNDRNTKIKIEGIPSEYTERIHSGNNSCWRTKQFRTDKKEFILEVPEKGLKSELINGEWFWICACPSCLGIKESYAYHVCDIHNVCDICGCPRKGLKETPYGIMGAGFRCAPCSRKIDREVKIKALELFESKNHSDLDFWHEDEIKCPHCDTVQSSDDRHESEKEIECETCCGVFDLEVDYSVSYSTSINGERVTLESVLKEESP